MHSFTSPIRPEQLLSAFGAEENYLLVRSLDASVVFLGSPSQKEEYQNIVNLYFDFKAFHIQGRFQESYLKIREVQLRLTHLYDEILHTNREFLAHEIMELGKMARGKEKSQTRAFFQMSLRYLKESETKQIMARNIHPKLYLLKLREQLFALKILKMSGRLALNLRLLHDEPSLDSIVETDFESLITEIKRGFSSSSDKYVRWHYDNHFQFEKGFGIFEKSVQDYLHPSSDKTYP